MISPRPHDDTAPRYGVVDGHRRQLVAPRPVDPHQFTVENQPEPGFFRIQSDLRTPVLVAGACADEADPLERWVVDLAHGVAPSGT